MTDGDAASDAELLAASSRDPAAFRAFYDRHAARIYQFALRRVQDADAATDITAESFARAWYAKDRFRDERSGSAAPWLFGITANVIRESVRRRRMATRAAERLGITLGVDRTPATPDPAWTDGLGEDLSRALAALPGDQRDAVLGRVVGDAPYAQLATALDCTPGTARARVSRGLSNLRRILEEDSDGNG